MNCQDGPQRHDAIACYMSSFCFHIPCQLYTCMTNMNFHSLSLFIINVRTLFWYDSLVGYRYNSFTQNTASGIVPSLFWDCSLRVAMSTFVIINLNPLYLGDPCYNILVITEYIISLAYTFVPL